jgi:acyl-CoA reductase-like NAD-dependent aldehyde dehydrogenase
MPGVFPDYPAPVIRNAGAEREPVLMRWGMPPPPRTGGPPVTNIRNTASPNWRGWLKPENRCIIVDYQPISVCVLITPWNLPAAMATRKIAPALAAGCTVVLKPASETPLTAYALAGLFEEAGVPPGVVNVLTVSNPAPATAAMLADPRVRKLSFTGSTGVGRLLLAEAAKHVISCSMELGGNAPFIVFDDVDLEAALDGAMVAKMRNAGEACTAANRIYVQSGIHDAFAERLRKRWRSKWAQASKSPPNAVR